MKTLNKHIRWRKEKNEILICDCERNINLKIPLEYEKELIKLEKGEKINERLETDFKKLNFLVDLRIKQIDNLDELFKLFDKFLKRVRTNQFLRKKYNENPKLFIGIYLDNKLIGGICGFHREDYFLISELAVDLKFRRRGFARLLVKEFGKKVKGKIHVGALDEAIEFYKTLGYESYLFIQGDNESFYIKNEPDLEKIIELRKRCPNLCFQYIFRKMKTKFKQEVKNGKS